MIWSWRGPICVCWVPDDVEVDVVDAGGVPAKWFVPPGADEAHTIIYIHGGGFVIGNVEGAYESMIARLALHTGMRVLAPDYRLAPEHPYPAALEDTLTAYRWLLEQGVDPDSITLSGESAGGNLVLAVMLSLREAGEALPGSAALMAPWVDLTLSGVTHELIGDADRVLWTEGLRSSAGCYAGEESLENPMISPLFADLSGLPPTLIVVGTNEILLADSTRLARRARLDGVRGTLDVWEGMPHAWPLIAADIPESRWVFEDIGAFIASVDG